MAKLSNEKAKAESIYNKNSKVSSNWASLKHVYNSMYQVLKLPNVQTFVVILLIAKFGFQASESATNLKLLEKGLSKEDLSITVLIDFPFEMVFGYYAGRWSNGKTPLKPWLFGFAGRLFGAFLAQMIVYFFSREWSSIIKIFHFNYFAAFNFFIYVYYSICFIMCISY